MAKSAAAVAVKATPQVQTSGGKVTVACKMPHGLILRAFEEYDDLIPVLGHGGTVRVEKRYREIPGKRVMIYGTAVVFGQQPKTRIVGGYALTEGVDKNFWDAWLAANKDLDLIKNRLVFAYDTTERAADAAKEHRSTTSGLEPLKPDNDPRRPKSPHRNVKDVQTADVEA